MKEGAAQAFHSKQRKSKRDAGREAAEAAIKGGGAGGGKAATQSAGIVETVEDATRAAAAAEALRIANDSFTVANRDIDISLLSDAARQALSDRRRAAKARDQEEREIWRLSQPDPATVSSPDGATIEELGGPAPLSVRIRRVVSVLRDALVARAVHLTAFKDGDIGGVRELWVGELSLEDRPVTPEAALALLAGTEDQKSPESLAWRSSVEAAFGTTLPELPAGPPPEEEEDDSKGKKGKKDKGAAKKKGSSRKASPRAGAGGDEGEAADAKSKDGADSKGGAPGAMDRVTIGGTGEDAPTSLSESQCPSAPRLALGLGFLAEVDAARDACKAATRTLFE